MIKVDVFEKALRYAAKKHRQQRRKGDGSPYFLHPISVVLRIKAAKGDSKNIWMLATASVLHDVVEDCGVSIRKIAKKFGYHVAALIEELTLDKSQYNIMGKTEYLCRHMANMSSYALTIKLCDRLDNICDMGKMNSDFQDNYVAETQEILQRLLVEREGLTQTQINLMEMIRKELLSYY